MEVRRAVQADEEAVLKLIGAEAYIITKRFLSLEIGKAIETSILSLVSLDGSGEVTGFACFGDRPPGTVADHKLRYVGRSRCLLACLLACSPARLLACSPARLPACLPARLSACSTVCLSVCLPVFLSVCLSVCLSAWLPGWMPACLAGCLAGCLSSCVRVCLPLSAAPCFAASG